MKKAIDPKYSIEIVDNGQRENSSIRIVNPAGVPIPEDEPLILIRARDKHARALLHIYMAMCQQDGCTAYHMQGIANRVEAFERFAIEHPGRMKQPGVTEGK